MFRRTHTRTTRKDFGTHGPITVAPHPFRRMGLIRDRGKCVHCFKTKGAHPTHLWQPARPWGDRR